MPDFQIEAMVIVCSYRKILTFYTMGKIIGIVVVIVLVVGGIMYFRNNRGEESVAPSPTETAVPNTEAQSVNYDGKSYTPDSCGKKHR